MSRYAEITSIANTIFMKLQTVTSFDKKNPSPKTTHIETCYFATWRLFGQFQKHPRSRSSERVAEPSGEEHNQRQEPSDQHESHWHLQEMGESDGNGDWKSKVRGRGKQSGL